MLVTEEDVASFDQFISAAAGPLGFTVLPVLEADIAPPMVLHCTALYSPNTDSLHDHDILLRQEFLIILDV